MPDRLTAWRVSCSFCGAICDLVPGRVNHCPACRHRSDCSRLHCDCRRCREGVGPLTAQAIDALAALLAARLRSTE